MNNGRAILLRRETCRINIGHAHLPWIPLTKQDGHTHVLYVHALLVISVMPISKVPVIHKFGIISLSQAEQLIRHQRLKDHVQRQTTNSINKLV